MSLNLQLDLLGHCVTASGLRCLGLEAARGNAAYAASGQVSEHDGMTCRITAAAESP